MKKIHKRLFVASLVAGLTSSGAAHSQAVNLSSETAGPTGVPGQIMCHMADVLAEKKIANLQVAQGQTLTN